MSKHIGNPSLSLLDHDINDSFDFSANSDPFHADAPASFILDAPTPLSFGAPTTVVYSSDLNPAHTPEVVMAAGSGGGASGGGTTTTSGATLVTGSGSGLAINVVWDSSVSSAPTGFTADVLQVAQYFVSHFTDKATLNINVGFGEAGGHSLNGALGMSLTYLQSSSYSQIQGALAADQTTTADASAVASLTGDPTGGGHYWISTAEAKAMGLSTSTTNTDGSVGFSSSSGIFDYDNSNGVSTGQYDFFGVVAHEFSEVMGRILLVGATVGGTANSYDVLDLFHYSAPGTHDLSGSLAGYFSVDNGTTDLHDFNTSTSGDAGDWATNTTPDAFDAFGTPGAVEPISASDLTVLDAIGWNAASSAPPPSLPDLTVSNLTLDNSGTNVSFQLHNAGTADAAFDPSKAAASLYLSTDSTITTADTKLGDVFESSSLTAGASLAISLAGNLSAPATAGTYYLGVIADPTGAVAESNESNNVSNVVPVILGSAGNNTLTGTSGKDIIIGFDGNDTITGSGGGDTLIGGSGADHFRYTAKTQGVDTIVDFSHAEGDVLDFSRLAFGNHLATNNANTGTLDASHFAVTADGLATAATAQFVYDTTSHVLSFDADGTGATGAVQIALLGSAPALANTDIHLV